MGLIRNILNAVTLFFKRSTPKQHWVYGITRKYDSHLKKTYSFSGLLVDEKEKYYHYYNKEKVPLKYVFSLFRHFLFFDSCQEYVNVLDFCGLPEEETKRKINKFTVCDVIEQLGSVKTLETMLKKLIEGEIEFKELIKNSYSDFLDFLRSEDSVYYDFYVNNFKLYHYSQDIVECYFSETVQNASNLEELKENYKSSFSIQSKREIRFNDDLFINAQYDEIVSQLIYHLKNELY